MNKFRNTILTMSMICLGLPMFTSCEEDEVQEWELTKLELAPTEDFDIPYKGGIQTFSFKTNNSWKVVSSGDWVTFDKVSGTGDATITATFAENSTIDNRKAVIRVISGEEPTPNNYVGVVTQTISTLQHSNYQDRIDAISARVIDATCKRTKRYSDGYSYTILDVKANIEVISEDVNTNELVLQVGADLCYYEYYDGAYGHYSEARTKTFYFNLGSNYSMEYSLNSGKPYSYIFSSFKPFIIFKNPDGSQRSKIYYNEVSINYE